MSNDPPSTTSSFVAAPHFIGARPGHAFKMGQHGLGYYADPPTKAAPPTTHPSADSRLLRFPDQLSAEQPAPVAGWVPMKTVAQLRRERGEGAPRNSDSLYRPIERAPRRFAPLKVPTALQRQLPFKSKPKVEAPRKRPTLEQRRAVVLEPGERKQVSLLQQLNTIRNRKAEARRAAVCCDGKVGFCFFCWRQCISVSLCNACRCFMSHKHRRSASLRLVRKSGQWRTPRAPSTTARSARSSMWQLLAKATSVHELARASSNSVTCWE